jgi:hypothetical protein
MEPVKGWQMSWYLKLVRVGMAGAALLIAAAFQGSPAIAQAPEEPAIVTGDSFVVTSWDHVWEGAITDDSGSLWAAK